MNLALILSKPFLPRGCRLLIREASIGSIALQAKTRHPRMWAWLYRHLYKRVPAIVCVSDEIADDLAEHFQVPRARLVRIYNSVDEERVRELAQAGENPYSGPGPHLVAAGRLTAEKGLSLLVAAMPAVLAHLPQAQVAVLGDGPLRTDLTEQAQGLGVDKAVAFLGFQQNPWRYFFHADLLVLPSRFEGMPNVVLEALALDLPVIASDCPGGIREIATLDARVSLVPKEDASSLAEAIIAACGRVRDVSSRPRKGNGLPASLRLQQVLRDYSALLSE